MAKLSDLIDMMVEGKELRRTPRFLALIMSEFWFYKP